MFRFFPGKNQPLSRTVSIPGKVRKPFLFGSRRLQEAYVEINIEGVIVRVTHKVDLTVPHELTVVLPRVEIRHRYFENGQPAGEDEIILNSITVVDAPRHPPENRLPGQTR
ncbi:MAG: hypothetical protein C4589_01500 [Peptococcaceae bacterium]|nr:MAG: hypothetical protein C4589_01500 [Peptococcaceae bacterium]